MAGRYVGLERHREIGTLLPVAAGSGRPRRWPQTLPLIAL